MIRHAMPCNPLTFQSLACASSDIDRDKASRLPYMQLIGSLLYLSTMTRPDIAYHMSILCSFMHDPTPTAYHAAIDLLLYVSASSLTLHFPGSPKVLSGIDSSLHDNIRSSGGVLRCDVAASERSRFQHVRVCGLLHGCASELHFEAA